MKKLYAILSAILITSTVFAQAPQKMSYQAVVRKPNNDLVVSHAVGVQISILHNSASGTAVYIETQTANTNANGLISLEIGGGTIVSGIFESIDWSQGTYFVKTEIDPLGGTSYTITGSSQILSVPYALYAKTAGSTSASITETDPVFGASPAKGITTVKIAKWDSAYNWGNHAKAGYVKNTSPTVAGNLMTYDGTNWVSKKLVIGNTGSGIPVNNIQPYLTLNYCIALQGIFPSRNGSEPFLGEIELYGFTFAPRGFATCDGQVMSISQNTALFSLLGTTYGGDGRTTFALPDLRGRVPLHFGQGPGLSNYVQGQSGGTENNTLLINNLPAHSHTVIYQ